MIIPAIDLIVGEVVRLYQGDYQQQTTYPTTPVQLALDYEKQGADWLHLVDLSGAKSPEKRQLTLIQRIVTESHMKIQAGGGVRTERDLMQLFDIGVSRVVVGSLAVQQVELVKSWITKYGAEQIVLALDIKIDEAGNKRIATHGWQNDSGIVLENLVDDYLTSGLKHILCTDISRDGTLTGPNIELYQALVARYPQISWQVSGGMSTLDDISQLKPIIENSGLINETPSGIILGRALLEGKFSLPQALSEWRESC